MNMKSKIGQQIKTRSTDLSYKCLFNIIISPNTNTQGPKPERNRDIKICVKGGVRT